MSHEVALRTEFIPQQALTQINAMADRLGKSGALPASIRNGDQLAMVMLAGYEAGMRPMESINAFYIVNGRLTMWGDALIRQLKRAGYSLTWPVTTDKEATCEITAPNGDKHKETFTFADAEKAGLIAKGGPWKTYPKDMLRWKAIGRGVRFFCPEVMGGTQYLKEEADDFEEIEAKPAKAARKAQVAPEAAQAIDITPPAKDAAQEQPAAAATTENGNVKGTILPQQMKRIHALRGQIGTDEEALNAWTVKSFGLRVSGLSEAQADVVIGALEKRLEGGATKPAETAAAEPAAADEAQAVADAFGGKVADLPAEPFPDKREPEPCVTGCGGHYVRKETAKGMFDVCSNSPKCQDYKPANP